MHASMTDEIETVFTFDQSSRRGSTISEDIEAVLMDLHRITASIATDTRSNNYEASAKIDMAIHLLKTGMATQNMDSGASMPNAVRRDLISRLNKSITCYNRRLAPSDRGRGIVVHLSSYKGSRDDCASQILMTLKCDTCGRQWNGGGPVDGDVFAPPHCYTCKSVDIREVPYTNPTWPEMVRMRALHKATTPWWRMTIGRWFACHTRKTGTL